MLLPVGHEQDLVRRVPWVTLALIAACFVVFLFTDREQARRSEALFRTRYREAVLYYRQHPYLSIDGKHRKFFNP